MLIDEGTVSYRLDRHRRSTVPRSVTVLPPHVVHDGSTADPDRFFVKRVLYLNEAVLPTSLVGCAVDKPTIGSRSLYDALSRLHPLLDRPCADLETDEVVVAVVDQISRSLRPTARGSAPSSDAAEALRSHLDTHLCTEQRLGPIARELGWDARHLIRSFTREFGLPPHKYLIGRRVDAARRRLLDGMPPSAVAAEVGFHDQSHLTRHFRAFTGTTPARFVRSR